MNLRIGGTGRSGVTLMMMMIMIMMMIMMMIYNDK